MIPAKSAVSCRPIPRRRRIMRSRWPITSGSSESTQDHPSPAPHRCPGTVAPGRAPRWEGGSRLRPPTRVAYRAPRVSDTRTRWQTPGSNARSAIGRHSAQWPCPLLGRGRTVLRSVVQQTCCRRHAEPPRPSRCHRDLILDRSPMPRQDGRHLPARHISGAAGEPNYTSLSVDGDLRLDWGWSGSCDF